MTKKKIDWSRKGFLQQQIDNLINYNVELQRQIEQLKKTQRSHTLATIQESVRRIHEGRWTNDAVSEQILDLRDDLDSLRNSYQMTVSNTMMMAEILEHHGSKLNQLGGVSEDEGTTNLPEELQAYLDYIDAVVDPAIDPIDPGEIDYEDTDVVGVDPDGKKHTFKVQTEASYRRNGPQNLGDTLVHTMRRFRRDQRIDDIAGGLITILGPAKQID